MPHMKKMSPEIEQCILDCLECYRVCHQSATLHCLELGGKHVEPNHFRLMLDCAESCRGAASSMLNNSAYMNDHCGMCAMVCRDCADSCRQLGDMEDCVAACERCAESCGKMVTGTAGGRSRATAGAERPSAH